MSFEVKLFHLSLNLSIKTLTNFKKEEIMLSNLVLAAIVGWCGTGWPIRFPGGGGGGGVEPGDWPPNCWVCGPLAGALTSIIVVYALGYNVSDGFATVAVTFFAGSFGAKLIGGIASSVRK